MQIFIIMLLVLLPEVALANSMGPILPVVSFSGWLAMPIIIAVEAYYYKRASINNPIRLACYANLWSGFVGLVPALLTAPIMLGPPVDSHAPIVTSFIFSTLGVIFHWWLSSYTEYRFAAWHKRWRGADLPISIFYGANRITYGLIYIWLLFVFGRG